MAQRQYTARISRSPSERALRYSVIALLHAIPLAALWGGKVRSVDWLVCLVFSFLCGMVGVNLSLHRYFSHRVFRTGRFFQFTLAWIATLTLTDPITFAGKHRLHHRFVDTARDVHGPQFGWWHSWIGSLVDPGYTSAELRAQARDLTRIPELFWLHRFSFLPALVTGGMLFMVGGFSMFAVGYIMPVMMIIHAAGIVNTLGHSHGYRRYVVADTSTNNFWVNLLSLGEGWHNNHHYYQASARCGLFPGEWDPVYRIIQFFSLIGLVYDVKVIPERFRVATTVRVGL